MKPDFSDTKRELHIGMQSQMEINCKVLRYRISGICKGNLETANDPGGTIHHRVYSDFNQKREVQ